MTADPRIFQDKTSQDRTSATVGVGIDSPERPAGSPAVIESGSKNRESLRLTPLDLWLHRVTVLLFVFVCAVVGVLLVILPWRPEWTDNRLLLTYPSLRAVVANGFFRGLCSGLGMLDIWVGFWEAIHYHEGERS
ncbi:MAG TPA: hypothetical protein VK763_17600 [Terriglobales bacterium]|nr:hypothetical protein [Terriglobales bacterium]